ncbi:TonB-dependent receptor [Simiduia agarivorans]|uniref:Oar protein n=1 Tax=Simiduia agarivorans (strain DSM 21679 / JCM 13881 / BCRC 17597 / SA1) TaxID=1117647 RepID=K4KZ81_SIMAS|nr:TonB-dependent receptor [Simiduia agarivorans]AFU99217.1 putative oar protein [Simiduia agarivorans SA1 = DSM 21679]
MSAKQHNRAWGWRQSALAVAIAALSTTPALGAETSGGSLKGRVTNSSGVGLANAEITVKHKDKGITRQVTTNESGDYLLRNLPVGEYDLMLDKSGFGEVSVSNVLIRVGQASVYDGQLLADHETMETIEVFGALQRMVDTGTSTAGLVITQEQLDAMPVGNGFEAMAVLAPGVSSSSKFGASSFGGSSSAENLYYLNGLNVSTIKTGIGSIRLPWEAIQQTEIKTGGINPEFGGALGGVVNAVSKSGSNEFNVGASYRLDPNAFKQNHDSVFDDAGDYHINTEQDSLTFQEANIWASGPLIEDKAFFYALYNPRNTKDTWAYGSSYTERERKEDRWFVTVDYQITDNHRIDVTGINYERNGERDGFAYDPASDRVGDFVSTTKERDGGQVYGFHYNGQLTDRFAVDVVLGQTREKVYNTAQNALPGVWDCRTGNCIAYSNHTDSSIVEEDYTRNQYKVDLRYDFDDHALQVGMDQTELNVDYLSTQNGAPGANGWWEVRVASANDVSGLPQGEEYIRQRIRDRGTDSTVTARAFYVQDSWQVSSDLVLNLGARYEQFENTVTGGEAYVDTAGLSPRLQAVWDVFGDGDTKAFASFGRYYQPVSANMNITQGSYSRETMDYYALAGVDADGRPLLSADGSPERGAKVRDTYVRQAGIVEPALIASGSLKGMYADEFTLGFERVVLDGMVVGVRGVYRDLKRSVEDTDIGPVLEKYFADNGITDNVGQGSYYVLNNPGEAISISYDFDGDGVVDNIHLSEADLALPKPSRTYTALETTFRGNLTDKLYLDVSYVLSKSHGNTEGLVRTDNGQADPGWTTSYDYADLMDHGKGDLPNDRRHVFKLNGYYDLTENWVAGFVATVASGAPKNYFSVHPDGVDSCSAGSPWEACASQWYDEASFYDENGNPAPRGSAGRLDWTTRVDLSLAYNVDLSMGRVNVKGTVYNLFNADTATAIVEQRSIETQNGRVRNPNYGLADERLTARFVTLEARYEF